MHLFWPRLARAGVFSLLLIALVAGCRSPRQNTPREERPRASLEQWRNLTSPQASPPRVFVQRSGIRFYFEQPSQVEVFEARWRRVRVPTPGYHVNSASLRWTGRLGALPTPERDWRPATVIAGAEWRKMAADLVSALAPAEPGQAAYYQAFLSDGYVFRTSQGVPRFAPLEALPPGTQVVNRYSADETLVLLAERMERLLSQTHPGGKLFLLMAPSATQVTHALLLDRERHRCVWLTPAALIETAEGGLNPAVTSEGLRALLLESHGLALVKNPISSLARLVDLGVETMFRWIYVRPPDFGVQIKPVADAPAMDLDAWEQWLDRYTGTHRQQGSMELLIDGPAFFPRFQAALEQATNRINLQVFIFDKDDVALEIADVLARRAKEVEVRLIFDRMGAIASGMLPPDTPLREDFTPPRSILQHFRKNTEVEVRPFLNPWFSTDHSKVLLVDGVRAWLGGMNIGREYAYDWHDMMVEVRGPVVATLQRDFDRSWAHEGLLGDAAYAVSLMKSPRAVPEPPLDEDWIDVRLLPTRTGWKPFSTAVRNSFRNARNHLFLSNPYLFDKRMILSLVDARRRGVDVRVILPRQNDFKAGHRGNLVIANYLLSNGVRVYFYPGMTHVKALLVDGWSCVGSGNLNHLSLRLNQEQNLATSDPAFAASLRKELFERDFERAYELKEPVSVDWVDFLTDLMLEGL